MENMTVLVLTYSGNTDVLNGFLECYQNNARSLPDVYIVSNSPSGFVNEYICEDTSFSTRLIYALERLTTRYVMLMLDDYYISQEVDSDSISTCLNMLENDEKLITTKLVCEDRFPLGIHKAPFRYGLSLGAGIWKVQQLLSLLIPNETAWEIELKGSFRLWRKKARIFFPEKSIVMYPAGGVIHKGRVPAQLVHLVNEDVLQKREVLYEPESMVKRRINLLMTLLKLRE